MDYAPIKAIMLKNFRSLEQMIIDFSESPIISIVGDNEAGKSSITKAMQTIGANLNPNTQRDYIRTDTDGFIVAVKFADPENTMVVRLKSRSINSFRVQKGDKVVWGVDKMDSSEVPPEIQKYMGFVIEPETKELLNVRTYEDLMVFIHTASSSNYKVIYNALKVDNILRAKKAGNRELLDHKRALNEAEGSVATLTEELRKIRLPDISPLLSIRERVNNYISDISEIENCISIRNRALEIDRETAKLRDLEHSPELDEFMVSTLNEAISLKEKEIKYGEMLKSLDEISSLPEIDEKIAENIVACVDLKNKLSSSEYEAYADVAKLNEIEVGGLERLLDGIECSKQLRSIDDTIENVTACAGNIDVIDLSVLESIENALADREKIGSMDDEANNLQTEINKLEAEMKQMGVKVATCPRCGETVIMGE